MIGFLLFLLCDVMNTPPFDIIKHNNIIYIKIYTYSVLLTPKECESQRDGKGWRETFVYMMNIKQNKTKKKKFAYKKLKNHERDALMNE